jgi:endonuclease YncB( thermonuclease family)
MKRFKPLAIKHHRRILIGTAAVMFFWLCMSSLLLTSPTGDPDRALLPTQVSHTNTITPPLPSLAFAPSAIPLTATASPTSTTIATSQQTEIAFIPIVIKPGTDCLPTDTQRQPATVIRVIDGDTIEVDLDGVLYQVRYIGMDTPERSDPNWELASAANADLVSGKIVTLVTDVSETDPYNRLLRYVVADGVFVNHTLVLLGYARTTTYPPDVACEHSFLEAEAQARAAGLGYWGIPTPTNLPEERDGPGFQLLHLSSPVKVGESASASIRTMPGADCTLAYRTPAGTQSQARGLGNKVADLDGICRWTWTIGSSTRPGVGSVMIRAGGQSETYPITIH